MELIINSKKYGQHTVSYDEGDHELISQFHWHIAKGKKNVFYVRARVKNKLRPIYGESNIRMHRLIMNTKVDQRIDHIDHDGRNNQKCNLRFADNSQNAANNRLQCDSSTGFKGVTFKKSKKLYLARIRVNGKLIYGGSFKCPLDAAKRYNELAIKHFGEFACINIITPELEKFYEINRPPTRRVGSKNKTGFIGISISKSNKKPFIATISVKGENVYLGNFETAKEAAKVYNEAVIEYGRPEYFLNKIPQ